MTDKAMQMEKTQKYDMPLSNLDYTYINDCENVKELEKIIKILRSGEEGQYPHLEQTATERLEKLNPKSRVLRKEIPVTRPGDLGKEEWSEINEDLKEWSTSMKNQEVDSSGDKQTDKTLPPVRQGEINTSTNKTAKETVKTNKPAAPRSYKEWDKIDIDKELETIDKKEEEKERNMIKDLKSNFEFEMLSVIHSEGLSQNEIYLRANREKDKGNEAMKCGDLEESVLYYTRSLSLLQTAAVYNNRALAYVKLEKWQEAIDDCTDVLKQEKDNIKALLRISTAYLGIEDTDSAESNLKLVTAQDKDNVKAQQLLKECCEMRKQKEMEKIKRKDRGGRRMIIEEVNGDEEDTLPNGKQKIEEIPISKQNGVLPNTKQTNPPKVESSKPKKDESDIWSLDEIESLVNVNADVDLNSLSLGIENPNVMPQKPAGYKQNYSNYDDEEEDEDSLEEIEVDKLSSSGPKIKEITDEEAEQISSGRKILKTTPKVHETTSKDSTEIKRNASSETAEEKKDDWSKTGARPKTVSPTQTTDNSTPDDKPTESLIPSRKVFRQEKLPRPLLAVKEEGSDLFRTGQYGKAILRYTNLIDELEKDASHQVVNLSLMYSNRAACYLKTGHSKAAMTDCHRSLDNVPHAIKPLLRRAAACEHLEKYGQAYIDYRHILSIDTSVQLAHSGSTRCQNILQQLDGPKWREKLSPLVTVSPWEVPEIILDIDSSSSSAKNVATPPPEDLPNPDLEFEECKKQGNSHVQKGEYSQAVEYYCKCVELIPDNPVSYTNRALCYLKLNRANEAVCDCNEALKLDSNNTKALYRRALARKMMKQFKDCLQDLSEVLKLDPKNTAALKEFDSVKTSYKEEWKHIKESTPPVEPIPGKKKGRRMKIQEVEDEDDEPTTSTESVQTEFSIKQSKKTNTKQENHSAKRSEDRKSQESTDSNSSKPNKTKKHKDKEESGTQAENTKTTKKVSKDEAETTKPTRKTSKDEVDQIKEDLDWLEPKQPEAPLSKSAKRRMKAKAKRAGSADITLDEDNTPPPAPEDSKTSKASHKGETVQCSDSKNVSKKSSKSAQESNDNQTNSDSKSAAKSTGEDVDGTASTKETKKKKQKQTGTKAESSTSSKIKSTPYEFMTAWNGIKGSKGTEPYTVILRQIPPAELPNVISNKLDNPMLSKILQCADKDFVSKGDNELGYKVLNNLTFVKRFTTISMMLSPQEKKDLAQVFNQLRKSNSPYYSSKDVDSLQKQYGVKS